MDNFRWILLAVGVVIVLIIYLISRKNRREFYKDADDLSEDLPDIKTASWDDIEEGVGEVRIIARHDAEEMPDLDSGPVRARAHSESPDVELTDDDADDPLFAKRARFGPAAAPAPAADSVEGGAEEPAAAATAVDESGAEATAEARPAETVLILSILARDGSSLSGDSINSVALANHMVFGEMNIYHRMGADNNPVFSMVNLLKPGSFDPETIHELQTPGISLFMQLPGPPDPSAALDDMLETAHRMAEALQARVCDRSRQPLTESIVEEYLATAAAFDGKVQ